MADNPKKRGKGDRSRVSSQKHELHDTARKLGVTWQAVAGAKRALGTSNRQRIEKYLRDKG